MVKHLFLNGKMDYQKPRFDGPPCTNDTALESYMNSKERFKFSINHIQDSIMKSNYKFVDFFPNISLK